MKYSIRAQRKVGEFCCLSEEAISQVDANINIRAGNEKTEEISRYDLAALKYWNDAATTNFPITNYSKELEEMKHMTKLEFIASRRRKSRGFSSGASIYRGVTRHHQQGRWQQRSFPWNLCNGRGSG